MSYIFYLLVGFIVLYAIVLHELAHGWVAMKCGDNTALNEGRLTLNPISHIDPVGTILVPIILYNFGGIIFGWAKPIRVNPKLFKNPKRDDILVSLAGIFTNLLFALFLALLLGLPFIIPNVDGPESYWSVLLPISGEIFNVPVNTAGRALYVGVLLNIGLAVFNLIPIPPLDGSHVLKHFLPKNVAKKYEEIGFIGIFIIFIMFNFFQQKGIDPVHSVVIFMSGWPLEITNFLRHLFGGG